MIDLLVLLLVAGFFIFKNFKKLNKFTSGNNEAYQNQNNNMKFNDVKEKINQFLGNNNLSNGKSLFQDGKFQNIILIILVGILFVWLASGFYIVQPDQQGVQTILGKYSKTTLPGLHYHLPAPIERVQKVKVTSVNTEEIGYRSSSSSDEAQVFIESTMVTKDENIIDVNFDVQWKIVDAEKYIFNIRKQDVSKTIRFAAESVMRDLIGQNLMSFALGSGRASLAEQAKDKLQQILNDYQIGVNILSIPIKRIDPPKQVIAAFRDVQSARADREREINMGQAYKNDIIPKARGEAAKVINEAEAYYYSTINKAEGEVAKMKSLYPLYKQNKDLIKTRLYTELLDEVFSDMNKIILPNSGDKNSNGQINLLNLNDIFKNISNNSSDNNQNKNDKGNN